jgi:hypothetical protein
MRRCVYHHNFSPWLISCVPRTALFPRKSTAPISHLPLGHKEVGATFPRTTDPLLSCPMGLYWLTYKCNGRLTGVTILSADSLMAARMRASANGISKGAMFEQGHLLDAQIATQLPQNVLGRMLERREAVELLAQIERCVGNVL